jgi:tRNA dimethylallyltransferase
VDPIAAERIHLRDGIRIVRALEIYALTGRPLGSPTHWRTARSSSNVLIIGLTVERERLYHSLEARVDRMIAEGLADEVQELLRRGYAADCSSMRGIGYRHLAVALQGHCSMEEAVRTMKRDTKRYAKRQWTWFQREPEVQWVKVDSDGEHLDTVRGLVSSWVRHR